MKTKIREYREKKGISQEELSKISGVSRTIISGLETGLIEETSSVTMKKIADALGKKIQTIFFID